MGKRQILSQVCFDGDGLIPVVTQDAASGEVLMLAWMNAESLTATINQQQAVYWSRSKQRLWRKGEQSGNTQQVQEIRLDCDGDSLLLLVEQRGGVACHTGRRRCFFRKLTADGWQITEDLLRSPDEMYGRDDG